MTSPSGFVVGPRARKPSLVTAANISFTDKKLHGLIIISRRSESTLGTLFFSLSRRSCVRPDHMVAFHLHDQRSANEVCVSRHARVVNITSETALMNIRATSRLPEPP